MELIEQVLISPVENFWRALKVYYEHPKCINKQVLFSEHAFGGKLQSSLRGIEDLNNLYNRLCDCIVYNNEGSINIKNLEDIKFISGSAENVNNIFEALNGIYLLARKMIPKRIIPGSEFFEFFILDKNKTKVFIYTKYISRNNSNDFHNYLSVLKYNYLELIYSFKELKVLYESNLGEKGINWLKTIFVPKFSNIILNTNNLINKKNTKKSSEKLSFTSCVDVVQYYKLYEEMKSKYAEMLIKNWTENTDPKKFVYEDIGIATYLMLLWNKENRPLEEVKKQKFVDLGCGNGLLVHILNSEGHLGVGLDMRKRKIWDTYHSKTVLKEEVIIPTQNAGYPEADWLIGNHSDELTSWIPIMARRSNDHCQYFVLPCCPYQLNGKKFQRQNSSLSSYQNFINYTKEISELCDFETYIDRLRIPSTKRVCLIGLRKAVSSEKVNLVNKKILDFIQSNCQPISDLDNKNATAGKVEQQEMLYPEKLSKFDFKVRETIEKVRNCTKLPQSLINEILNTVMITLLKEKEIVSVTRNNDICTWNRGGKLTVEVLAKAIDHKSLQQLKKECKGLQTLLKNQHYLFEVSNGFVQFRSPESLEKISNNLLENGVKSKWKVRNCWFYDNHPDGCPLSNNICCYNHV